MNFPPKYISTCFLRRGRQLLLIAALGVSANACKDGTGPEGGLADADSLNASPGATILEVTPAGPITLAVGDTVTLRPATTEAAAELNFASSDTTLLTVTSSGLVTARIPGEGRVVLTSKTNPRAAGSVVVRVQSRGPSAIALAEFDVASAANRDNVSGVFTPLFAIQRGDAAKLEVRADTVVVCTRTLPPVSSPGTPETISCPVDTAAFDSVSGTPKLLNGNRELNARLLRSDSREVATATLGRVRLNNPDAVIATLTPTRSAQDATGKRWYNGTLTVTAIPVRYSGGPPAESARFALLVGGGSTLMEASDPSSPFTVAFTAAQLGVRNYANLQLRIATELVGGQTGPSFVSPEFGYDAVAPELGPLQSREWIGANVEFASLYTPASPDAGIGITQLRFLAAPVGTPDSEIFARGTRVERGSSLAQSGAGAYRLAYQICDALENCSSGSGFTFGVDLAAPTISQISVVDRSINPPGSLDITVRDDLSGLSATPVEATVQALLEGAERPVCGPIIENGLDLPGSAAGTGCTPALTGTTLPVPQSTAGYYFYRAVVVDRAGNRTAAIERVVLIDRVRPGLSSFTIGSGLIAGEEAVVSAQAVDNLDLAFITFALSYPRIGAPRLTLPFTAVSVGTPFSGKLTRSGSVNARLPVVRSLTSGTRGTPDRSTVLADSIFAEAVDAAQFRASAGRAVTASTISASNAPTDPFPAITNAVVAAPTRICSSGCTGAESTATATVQVIGEPGISPMNRVYLFARNSAGRVTLLTSSPGFEVRDTGTQRTIVYTLTFSPPIALEGAHTVFGVGVSAAGNGLKSNDVPVEFYTR